ncbi:MAG: hypothetical protein HY328_10810 [Chloroflexi bacterium]|nr:hypothetical protein [Chloroflexota bacterium]
MAITAVFTPVSMTAAQYDEIVRRLEEAGAGAPPGRLYHVCCGEGDQLRVTDVWESDQTFQRFGQVLMPILQQVGVDPGQPAIDRVHNVIEG